MNENSVEFKQVQWGSQVKDTFHCNLNWCPHVEMLILVRFVLQLIDGKLKTVLSEWENWQRSVV